MYVSSQLQTRNFTSLSEVTGNLYATTAIIAKRAKRIATQTQNKLQQRLAEFEVELDNFEEILENKERIDVSKTYERQPKPVNIAVEEALSGQLRCKFPDREENA